MSDTTLLLHWSSNGEFTDRRVDNDCGSQAELAGQSLSVTLRVDDDAISHNYPPGPNERGIEGPGFFRSLNIILLSTSRCEIFF